jgi:hypothetical protein
MMLMSVLPRKMCSFVSALWPGRADRVSREERGVAPAFHRGPDV